MIEALDTILMLMQVGRLLLLNSSYVDVRELVSIF